MIILIGNITKHCTEQPLLVFDIEMKKTNPKHDCWYRITQVGRELQRSSTPTSCSRMVHLFGQSMTVFLHHHGRKFFSSIELQLSESLIQSKGKKVQSQLVQEGTHISGTVFSALKISPSSLAFLSCK